MSPTPAPSSPARYPARNKRRDCTQPVGGGGQARSLLIWSDSACLALWGNLVRTWSVSPEVRREVSLASRFLCVRPRQNGQGCSEVSWVLPAVRDPAPGALDAAVSDGFKKKKRFENKKKRKKVGWVGRERKEEGGPVCCSGSGRRMPQSSVAAGEAEREKEGRQRTTTSALGEGSQVPERERQGRASPFSFSPHQSTRKIQI